MRRADLATVPPRYSRPLELLDAAFECGCWYSQVGCIRHPAIVGTMCCPRHLLPYGPNPPRRPFSL